MFETNLYGIFLLGASKSDFKERKKLYYKGIYFWILEFPWVLHFCGKSEHENKLCVYLLTYPLSSNAKINKNCKLKIDIG